MSGYIIGFVALLALSALFSAAESAYTECNRLRIDVRRGRRQALCRRGGEDAGPL